MSKDQPASPEEQTVEEATLTANALLRNKHIIKSRRDGNKVYHSIRNDKLLKLISNMRSVLCHTNLDD